MSSSLVPSLHVQAQGHGGAPLRGSFRAALDRRGQAHLPMLFSASCSLLLRDKPAAAADGGAAHSSAASSALRGTMLLPSALLSLTPLYGKRLCDVPLVTTLCSPSPSSSRPINGLLSLDQARSLLPMAADDPNVSSWPRGQCVKLKEYSRCSSSG